MPIQNASDVLRRVWRKTEGNYYRCFHSMTFVHIFKIQSQKNVAKIVCLLLVRILCIVLCDMLVARILFKNVRSLNRLSYNFIFIK